MKTITKEYLIEKYSVKKLTSYEIAKEVSCHPTTIIAYLRKFNLPVRNSGESQRGKTRPPLSPTTIEKIRLKNLGQKRTEETKRNISKAQLGRIVSQETREKKSKALRGRFLGRNSSQYIDGRTPLRMAIRRDLVCSKEWREQIFERDNYICKKCGKKGGKLEAHHIIPFVLLFNTFLSENTRLNPITNREELLQLAIDYLPFWDINNGVTLCHNCHRKIKNPPPHVTPDGDIVIEHFQASRLYKKKMF